MKRNIKIPYGKGSLSVEIDEGNLEGIVYPNKVEIKDEIQTLKDAITNPINSKTFREFLSDAKDVLFIVNDVTRPTPTAKIIDILYEQIKGRGGIKFIIATGIHREPTEEEYQKIFGQHYQEFKDRIYSHDSKKDKDMVCIGKDRWVNRLAPDAHKIVIIGSVEPHYFGGYTGGRKSFLPGIAAYKTIEQNHKLALSPKARALVLEENPVHEDMENALKALKDKEIFAIMTVVDKDHKVYAATAGDIRRSFNAAIQKSNQVSCVKIDKKVDIVVAVAKPPLDIDLIQLQKVINNGKHSLKEDGILILVSPCREGRGQENFIKLLSSCRSPQEVLDKINKEYKLGYHIAAKIAEISLRAKIWGVTSIDKEVMESIFIRPVSNLQQAVDMAIEEKGGEAKVLFLMDGGLTVPIAN